MLMTPWNDKLSRAREDVVAIAPNFPIRDILEGRATSQKFTFGDALSFQGHRPLSRLARMA
jgi:hypothetical protein